MSIKKPLSVMTAACPRHSSSNMSSSRSGSPDCSSSTCFRSSCGTEPTSQSINLLGQAAQLGITTSSSLAAAKRRLESVQQPERERESKARYKEKHQAASFLLMAAAMIVETRAELEFSYFALGIGITSQLESLQVPLRIWCSCL